MTHLEIENLASDYVEGQLEPALRVQVEEHLAGCAACRELVTDLGSAIGLCRDAGSVLPPPWLISKILLATVGERKPTVGERLTGWFRPVLSPRFAYTVAMAVFSFSIILNAAGLNLRKLNLTTLNPRTWIYNATRTGHLMVARAEKFYYDLRFVYEIQSRFRQLQAQPPFSPSKPASKPTGATTAQPSLDPRLAWTVAPVVIYPGLVQDLEDEPASETVTPSRSASREPGRSRKP
jgi:hypothetical protein